LIYESYALPGDSAAGVPFDLPGLAPELPMEFRHKPPTVALLDQVTPEIWITRLTTVMQDGVDRFMAPATAWGLETRPKLENIYNRRNVPIPMLPEGSETF